MIVLRFVLVKMLCAPNRTPLKKTLQDAHGNINADPHGSECRRGLCIAERGIAGARAAQGRAGRKLADHQAGRHTAGRARRRLL